MKCLMCESLSLIHICKHCQTKYLSPQIYKRTLDNGIDVISFYKYDDIKELLHTKHTDLGFYIYNILAKLSFKKFSKEFEFHEKIVSIPIDDNIKSGYSHTAILNKNLNSKTIKAQFNKLRSINKISYSGKDKAFRLLNPREFKISNFNASNVILVDDIVTTGSTLNKAIELMKNNNKEVLFCITLTDVSIKDT